MQLDYNIAANPQKSNKERFVTWNSVKKTRVLSAVQKTIYRYSILEEGEYICEVTKFKELSVSPRDDATDSCSRWAVNVTCSDWGRNLDQNAHVEIGKSVEWTAIPETFFRDKTAFEGFLARLEIIEGIIHGGSVDRRLEDLKQQAKLLEQHLLDVPINRVATGLRGDGITHGDENLKSASGELKPLDEEPKPPRSGIKPPLLGLKSPDGEYSPLDGENELPSVFESAKTHLPIDPVIRHESPEETAIVLKNFREQREERLADRILLEPITDSGEGKPPHPSVSRTQKTAMAR